MDLRSRLIAPLFRSLDSGKKIFDIDAFVKRTILFDSYIIDSERLNEVPHIIRIFGFDGFLTLFESGFVKLNCHVKNTASLGSNFFLKEAPSNKIRPPLHYSFTAVSTGDLYHNINLSLQSVEPDIDLTSRQLVRMRKTVYSSLASPQDDSDELSIKSTKSDLVLCPDLLAKALVISIRNQIGAQVNYQDIKVSIVIDIPVFGDKLAFLASAISPNLDEERFQRVVKVVGLPPTEALEFRQWLKSTDNLSDDEIANQVRSLSKTVGRLIGGEVGQNIRFLITNGIGFVPVVGQAISTSLSILDKFLIDKIFPRSGISAFIDDMYPSLFDK